MDKVESELKYNTIVNDDNMAVEIIKDYMKTVKRLWITNLVLIGVIVGLLAGGLYFISTYEVTTTVETVSDFGNFQQYKDNSVHNEGGE